MLFSLTIYFRKFATTKELDERMIVFRVLCQTTFCLPLIRKWNINFRPGVKTGNRAHQGYIWTQQIKNCWFWKMKWIPSREIFAPARLSQHTSVLYSTSWVIAEKFRRYKCTNVRCSILFQTGWKFIQNVSWELLLNFCYSKKILLAVLQETPRISSQ